MTSPSPKEALELKPCPFCNTAPAFGRMIEPDQVTIGCNNDGCLVQLCVVSDVESEAVKAWNTRATFQPDGERREAIARIIAGPLCDATKGEHSIAAHGNYQFCTQCGETISKRWHGIVDARNKADAILASGLVQNEAGWRDISTAPKDGTWFLGWSETDKSPYRIVWGCNHRGVMTWCTAFSSFNEGYITHWMPLPAIRSARDGGAS